MTPAETSEIIGRMLANRAAIGRQDSMAEIANPASWDGGWRDYVPLEIRREWNRMDMAAKVAVYVTAVEQLRRDGHGRE